MLPLHSGSLQTSVNQDHVNPRTVVILPCGIPQGWESEDLFSPSWEAGGGAHASTLDTNLFPEVQVRIWGQAKWPWSSSPAYCSFISSLSVVTPFSTHFLLLHVKNSLGIHIISLFSCSVVIFSKNCTWTLSILFCLFQLTCCFCFYFYYLFSFMYCQLLCCFFGTF